MHPLAGLADAIFIINLPYRADRRAEMGAELARLGLGLDDPRVRLFEAVRPEDAGEFPSIGARGCFMSHLGVLRAANAQGLKSVLILEDDADFTPEFVKLGAEALGAVAAGPWDILYLGYAAEISAGGGEPQSGRIREVAPALAIRLTHAMIVRGAAIARIADYLEKMAARRGGDKAGGPMHVDGAYSWFRRDNRDIVTAIAAKPWAVQRASATDIHDTGWKERIPFLGAARKIRNRLFKRRSA
ncbi:MAG: glycosyltransferase family 25 protein [Parvularculaceae bacterium]|nr:glycosyltransferase family 25 protein [Parvularculaceae bacterium]